MDLFTTKGYAATSLREIAEALGINKASLYYHFRSKEDILLSLFEDRGSEAEELVTWLQDQPPGPGLLQTAVMRWVGSFSADKLRGIRFLTANPLVLRGTDSAAGDRISASLTQLVDSLEPLLPSRTGADVVLLRMAILSINAAVEAAAGTDIPDQDILDAAHRAANRLLAEIGRS